MCQYLLEVERICESESEREREREREEETRKKFSKYV